MSKKIFLSALSLVALNSSFIYAQTSVYIGTSQDGIHLSTLDESTGKLTESEQIISQKGTEFMNPHPSKPIIYSTGKMMQNAGVVIAYKILDSGKLKEINRQPTGDSSLCHISLDATGKMLMGANYGKGYAISYPLFDDGSIEKFASKHQHEGSSVNPQRQKAPYAHSIYTCPNNKFAYSPNLGSDKIEIYTIDPAKGTITSSGFAKSPAGAGPRHMKFSKDGKFAYVLNELTVDISVFSFDPETGKLTDKQLISTLPEGSEKNGITCSEIRVSNDGKLVYCANRDTSGMGRDTLSVLSVQADGTLKFLQNLPAEAWIPRNIHLTPSGKFLLVAGQKSNNVSVFKIDPETGKLSYTGNRIDVSAPMTFVFRNKK